MKKMQSRMRRHYIGTVNTESESLLGNGRNGFKKPFPWTQVLIGIIALIAVSGFVMGIISMTWGKNDVNDPLNIETLNVSGSTILSELEVSNGVSTDTLNVSGSTTLSELEVSNGISTDTLTVSDTANITCVNAEKITTNTTCNTVLEHFENGILPASHNKHILKTVPNPPVPQFSAAPLGEFTAPFTSEQLTVSINTGAGPYLVRDLAADDLTASGDAVGTRVVQIGQPEAWGGTGIETDPNPPTGFTHSLDLVSSVEGTLVINLRYSTEPDFDFVNIRKNGVAIFTDDGIGPGPSDGFLSTTQTIAVTPSDIITVEFDKDDIWYGGYDIVYFYADFISGASGVELSLPSDLSAYIGKEFEVCSAGTGSSLISDMPFGINQPWNVIDFTVDGCCVKFSVSELGITMVSRDSCAIYCDNTDRFHCVDPERPAETNSLHGWAKSIVKSFASRSLIHIDMSVIPIKIKWCGFDAVGFRCTSNLDAVMHKENILSFNDGYLQFQPQTAQFVFYYADDGTDFGANEFVEEIFQQVKDETIPALRDGLTVESSDIESPPNAFKALVDLFLTFQHGMNREHTGEFFSGNYPAFALRDEIISTGITETSNIIRTRITSPFSLYGETEFRLETLIIAVNPAFVTVSGFEGACAVLNGEHGNFYAGTTKGLVRGEEFMDFSSDPNARSIHSRLMLIINSTGLPTTAENILNISACPGSTPQVSVSYGPLTANSNLQAVGAAYNYWRTKTTDSSIHINNWWLRTCNTPNTIEPIITYEDVRDQINICGGGIFSSGGSSRLSGSVASIPINPVTIRFTLTRDRVTDWTGISGIFPDSERPLAIAEGTKRSTFSKHIALDNYIINAKYPVYRTVGTSRCADSPVNQMMQIEYPGGNCDEFETELRSMNELPGGDFNYFGEPLGFSANIDDYFNQRGRDNLFVGMINTNYTGGVKIGYLRFSNEILFDDLGLAANKFTAPSENFDPASPRHKREALVKMYSTFMEYLVTDLNVDHIIIDSRANEGGYLSPIYALRELFGSEDQRVIDARFKDHLDITGQAPSIDTTQFSYDSSLLNMSTVELHGNVYPSISEINYPGAVFTDGHVHIMMDTIGGSSGDMFPNFWLGSSFDKQLGSNTNVSIIGEVYGTNYGAVGEPFAIPISNIGGRINVPGFGAILPQVLEVDEPFPNYRADGSPLSQRHPALAISPTTLSGLSGGNAMPADWETLVYPDLGYRTNPRTRLSGDLRPQTPSLFNLNNPIETFMGTNVVRIDTLVAHNYSVGDEIALNDVRRPVDATGTGFTNVELTGSHIITAIPSATTFEFEIAGGSVGASSATGFGGAVRVMNRGHWRDAWLEASIETLVAAGPTMKKKKKKKSLLKKKKKTVPKKFDPRSVRSELLCKDGMELRNLRDMPPTVVFKVQKALSEERKISTKDKRPLTMRSAIHQFGQVIESELKNGGMCYSATGRLMATPTCRDIPSIKQE